jgi:hypothetical protein
MINTINKLIIPLTQQLTKSINFVTVLHVRQQFQEPTKVNFCGRLSAGPIADLTTDQWSLVTGHCHVLRCFRRSD